MACSGVYSGVLRNTPLGVLGLILSRILFGIVACGVYITKLLIIIVNIVYIRISQ